MSIDPIVPKPAPVPAGFPAAPPLSPPVLSPLPPVLLQAVGGPLTPEHFNQLTQAEARARLVHKAAGVAMFNGWTFAVFAGMTGFIALISCVVERSIDFKGLAVTAGLIVVAWNEFKGRRMLRQLDIRAPRLLGWNQVGVLVLVIGYCAWSIATAYLDKTSGIGQMMAEVGALGVTGGVKQMVHLAPIMFYGVVALGSVIFQGLNAQYYFSRAKILKAYLNETPAWIVEVQRRSAGA
jgi:hypothetical protein